VKVTLITNPKGDMAFRGAAQACLDDGAQSPAGLQHCLRQDYPDASVADGIVDRGAERWYAYREGVWIDSAEPPSVVARRMMS
jgi:hypothetical protein